MNKSHPTCDVFCQVVDNFGDVGVTWRLARQLANEHHLAVRLYVDDLGSLAKIVPPVDAARNEQCIEQVTVVRWQKTLAPYGVADLVIEAFGCDIPREYLLAMASQTNKPVWINLEYLSAEPWVETHHLLASPHPQLPLTKYFFFPGFVTKTGGLIREGGMALSSRTLPALTPKHPQRIFVFGYVGAPLEAWLRAVEKAGIESNVTIAEGELCDKLKHWRGLQATNGLKGAPVLEVNLAKFVAQAKFDSVLMANDILFVRGEDSFVRALWTGKPFVWQIYPQKEGTHWTKLNAFLVRYCQGLAEADARVLRELWRAWNANDADAIGPAWLAYCLALPALRQHALDWARRLEKQPDLASNLLSFYRKIAKI